MKREGQSDPGSLVSPSVPAVDREDAVIVESARITLHSPDAQSRLERFGFTVEPGLGELLLSEVRSAHAQLGVAPDDPRIALNWSFHSQSGEHKRAVKAELNELVRPVLQELFVEHEPYLTTFITKWPGPNSAFAPHQDPSLVDERRYRGVTVWIPLVDTCTSGTGDNGMLHVVPGSHRFSRGLRVSDVDQFRFEQHESAIIERHGVGVPVRAGQALIFDNRLIHFSAPNTTAEPRVVASFGMRPAESSCVLLRTVGGDGVDMYEIPDDFYIDVLPAEQHLWKPPGDPMAHMCAISETLDVEEFDRLCEAVGPAPNTLASGSASTAWSEPGAFCAFCGRTDSLSSDERDGRNNAQLVCGACAAGLPVTFPDPS